MAKQPKNADKNSKISESMKAFHEKKKLEEQRQKEIQDNNRKRVAAISTFRDPYRTPYLNITSDGIRSVLESVKAGYLQSWADFCDWILENDPLIHSLVAIRTNSLTKKRMIIAPADRTPEAVAAADFIRKELMSIENFDKILRQMLYATFTGCSALEIIWDNDPITEKNYVKYLEPILLRKIKIRLNPEDTVGDKVFTRATTGYGKWIYSYWNQGDQGFGEGVDFDFIPGKFVVHSPGDHILPHYRGLFRSIAYAWFYKQTGYAFWASGAERTAYSTLYAKVPPETEGAVRDVLLDSLNQLSSNATAVVDNTVEIQSIPLSTSGGDAVWKTFVENWSTEIVKLIIGATLTTDAGGNGSYALGGVHERVSENLMESDANALAETIQQQLVKYLLEYNLHLFGGVMPPVPTVSFDVSIRQTQPIDQLIVDAGAITVNELRESRGLTHLTDEEGGNKIAKLVSTATPEEQAMFSIGDIENFDNASTAYNGKKKIINGENQ